MATVKVTFWMDKALNRRLKHFCVNQDRTMRDVLTAAVMERLPRGPSKGKAYDAAMAKRFLADQIRLARQEALGP